MRRAASTERLLVINADDLGISENVNDAILRAHRIGVVTSASLMPTGPAFDDAARKLLEAPDLGIGVHLDTSEFHPLTKQFNRVRLNAPQLNIRTARWLSGSQRDAIEHEWLTQIMRCKGMGIEVSHLDSHHFDHVNPVLLRSLIRVARETGIRRVRGMHNLWVDPPNTATRAAKAAHRRILNHSDITTTDRMCDVGSYLTLLEQNKIPNGSIELMAHPGHTSYKNETDRLISEGPRAFATETLVSWHGISVAN